MASNPTGTFQCPNCGSPLTAHGSDKEIQCSYCGSTVIVPEGLREAPPPPPAPVFEYRPTPSTFPQTASADSASSAGCATKAGLFIGVTAAVIGIAVAGFVLFFLPSRVQSTFQQSNPVQDNIQSTTDAALSVAQNAVQTANALVKTSVPSTPT